MKRTTLLTSAGALLLSGLSMQASAQSEFVAADGTLGTQLCMAVSSNSRHQLTKIMSETGANSKIFKNKLQCNNLSVREFASLYGFERSLQTLRITPLTQTSIHDLAFVHGTKLTTVSGS
ncbi:DUF3718 domain-containing protein [Pseudoalteromonas pernae]|uniref:DUF3718 domain-containing protein n=1 Tax=Pseudoalteromonas pernae TaxID=3118054 RepID=UPI0032423497